MFSLRRRRAMSIMEALIVIAVLAVVLWAILYTLAGSTELYTAAKVNINARILANSWFEVFETVPPEDPFDMEGASDYVAGFLDASYSRAPNGEYSILGYRVAVSGENGGAATNGVRTVTLTVDDGGTAPFVMERKVNALFSEPASDDKIGERP